jgi:hypothetical protein
VIQLTGTQADAAGASFPESQTGIKLGRKCKRLHFLQAAGWQAEEGKVIGKYVLHYAGGETASLNIVYGTDTLDWWKGAAETKSPQAATVVWTGSSPAADAVGFSLRLFKRTYDNPKPDLAIETLDFVSTKAESAPFLVALTVED